MTTVTSVPIEEMDDWSPAPPGGPRWDRFPLLRKRFADRLPVAVIAVALHEAGHAVVARHLGLTVHYAYVEGGRREGHGRCGADTDIGGAARERVMMRFSAGGMAAGELFNSDAESHSDLMGLYQSAHTLHGLLADDGIIAAEVKAAREEARAIVQARLLEVETVAALLLQTRIVLDTIPEGPGAESSEDQ